MKNALLISVGWILSGCVYVFTPRMVTYYDKDCDVVFREMTLTVEQQVVIPVHGCSDEAECIGLLGAIALTTPVSAIVSGSIVVVGNTVFWMEKQGRCLIKEHLVRASQ